MMLPNRPLQTDESIGRYAPSCVRRWTAGSLGGRNERYGYPRGVAEGASGGYTFGMKTAISLPDPVFEEAERYAKRAKKSRSQVFSEAVQEYLARHSPGEVTEAMNAVCEQIGDTSDAFARRAGRRVLGREKW